MSISPPPTPPRRGILVTGASRGVCAEVARQFGIRVWRPCCGLADLQQVERLVAKAA